MNLDKLIDSLNSNQVKFDPHESERLRYKELCNQYDDVEYFDALNFKYDIELLNILPTKLIKKYKVLPFCKDSDFVHVAFSNIEDLNAIDDIEIYLEFHNKKLKKYIAYPFDLNEKIERFVFSPDNEVKKLIDEILNDYK